MIRVAAVGDIHMGPDSQGLLRPAFDTLDECADLLLLAGDLTRHGTPEEARVVAREVGGLPVPVVAVLGNHDHHDEQPEKVTGILQDAGVTVLEGEGTVVECAGSRVGVAGTKGFCGGFVGRSAGEFGEPLMKEFVRYTRRSADALHGALEDLGREGCDTRIALTHFSPVADTLAGEPLGDLPVPRQLSAGRGDRHGRRRPLRSRPRPHGHRTRDDGRRGPGAQRGPAGDPAGVQRLPAARGLT
ncbi:Icc-related predicted phosphoesterase [Streptomyces phaeoluteigriseus]